MVTDMKVAVVGYLKDKIAANPKVQFIGVFDR